MKKEEPKIAVLSKSEEMQMLKKKLIQYMKIAKWRNKTEKKMIAKMTKFLIKTY